MALALSSVVIGLTWVLLDSSRQVADEISQPLLHPLTGLAGQLQNELDGLLPRPVDTKAKPISFSEDGPLEMVTLIPNARGVAMQTRVRYWVGEESLLRSHTQGFPPVSQTNVVAGKVEALQVVALHEGERHSLWPPEKTGENTNPPEIPARLEVTVLSDSFSEFQREYYLPASYKVEKPGPAEEDP